MKTSRKLAQKICLELIKKGHSCGIKMDVEDIIAGVLSYELSEPEEEHQSDEFDPTPVRFN